MKDQLKKEIIRGIKDFTIKDLPESDKEFEEALSDLECLRDDINYFFERIKKLR